MPNNVAQPNTVQVLARKKWTATLPDWTHDMGLNKQKLRHTIRLEFILAKAELNSPVTLWVSMKNSEISPGKIAFDTKDTRGWFQDKVTVKMHLARPSSQKGKQDAVLDDMLLVASGPETKNGSGSVSSSVSFSFGGSISGGFFGETPTANAGVNASVSESHSFSHSYQDFETTNDSTGKSVNHTYGMELVEGAKYGGSPGDLFDQHSISGILGAVFGVHQLYKLPKLAKSDLPLIDQAVWQANHNKDIAKDAELVIEIGHHLGWCSQSKVPNKKPITGLWTPDTFESSKKTVVHKIHQKIPFAELTKIATGASF